MARGRQSRSGRGAPRGDTQDGGRRADEGGRVVAGRSRAGRSAREPAEAEVCGGVARLLPDSDRTDAWHLLIDGAPQSHVDLAEPTRLSYEYQRRLGHITDLAAPPGTPLHVVHLGGGAATLARYVAATRPRSTQQIAEPDTRLTEFVRGRLPLPTGARVRVRGQDARELLERLPAGSADLVISDVFDGARTPAHCTSGEYLDAVRRVLRPDGWYAANLADGGPLTHLRGQLATLRSRFAELLVTADPAVLRGRRFGNAVVLAADAALPAAGLGRLLAAEPHPVRVLAGRQVAEFAAGAAVVTDATASASPPPPTGTFD